jgi:uroporphyrinogen-III synthase
MGKTKIKTVLVSQPKPADLEKSPFFDLSKKHGLKIEYRKFFKIERLTSREFREFKIYPQDYHSIILTSRQAVDHYFSMIKDLRFDPPDTFKYFCLSEAIALYLQKYIQFRKRKIFHCNNNFGELTELMKKHDKETFLLPCSDEHNETLPNFLTEKKFNFRKAVLFRTLKEDLNDLDLSKFDMLVFFSPAGIKSLRENFPNFVQDDTIIAGFGDSTSFAMQEMGLRQDIKAPTEQFPSMIMAIEDFLIKLGKKK